MADGYGMPAVDFGVLGSLPEVYQKAQQQRSLADLGKGLADGTVDFRQAAGLAAQSGRPDLAIQFLQKANEKEAYEKFQGQLPGILGGQQQESPQPTLASLGRPQPRPPMGGMPPEESAPMGKVGQFPVRQATEGITSAVPEGPGPNQGVNIAADNFGQRPGAVMAPQPQPQPAQGGAQQRFSPQAIQLIQTMANPDLPAGARAAAQTVLSQMLPEDDKVVTTPDGDIVLVNARNKTATPLIKSGKPMVLPPGSSLVNSKGEILRDADAASRLDPQTITDLAEQLRRGDTSVLTNLGRGAQGAMDIRAIRTEMARLNREEGKSGGDQATQNAGYKADAAGMRTNASRVANVEYAANTANRAITIADNAMDKVPRTQFLPINKLIVAWQTNTGSPEQAAAGAAVNTLINEYARVVSPSGVPTEGTRQHARDMLTSAQSHEQFKAVTGMMRQEIVSAKAAGSETRQELRDNLSGKKTETTPAPVTPPQKVGSFADVSQSMSNAQAAIKGGADREAVIKKLIDGGVPPEFANGLR